LSDLQKGSGYGIIFGEEERLMRSLYRQFAPVLLAVALAAPVVITGCAAHVRYYDPYYNDYHGWDHREVVYYNQWEHDTHRNHQDFNKRSDADKKEYWTWRHGNQNGHH
jgi:hypothetical protein